MYYIWHSAEEEQILLLIFLPVAVLRILTHIRVASPRSDAAKRGISSGSQLFASRIFYKNWNQNEKKCHSTTIKTKVDPCCERPSRFFKIVSSHKPLDLAT